MDKRFGLFVHFGVYAIKGVQEQEIYRKGVPRAEYEKYADIFNPSEFDPDEWIAAAKDAGMEYMVFTTKHLDGFSMWDTAYSEFKITNTPYGKDFLRLLADACHRHNFPLELYYCIVDDHHPAYPHQGRAYEMIHPVEGDIPELSLYLDYVKNQIRELCENYGEIHGIWWDANIPEVYDEGFNNMIRRLQPKAVINGRGFDEGDYSTPEREYNEEEIKAKRRFEKPTEACQAVGMHSWGFRFEEDYYSSKYLMRCIDRALSMGGNYLLNVGPMADGRFPEESLKLLTIIGAWYKTVRESYYGAEPVSDITADRDIFVTVKGKDVYVHLNADPIGDSVELKGFTLLPGSASLLNDGRELIVKRDMGNRDWQHMIEDVRIRRLPVEEYNGSVMVVKLVYDELPSGIKNELSNRI